MKELEYIESLGNVSMPDVTLKYIKLTGVPEWMSDFFPYYTYSHISYTIQYIIIVSLKITYISV